MYSVHNKHSMSTGPQKTHIHPLGACIPNTQRALPHIHLPALLADSHMWRRDRAGCRNARRRWRRVRRLRRGYRRAAGIRSICGVCGGAISGQRLRMSGGACGDVWLRLGDGRLLWWRLLCRKVRLIRCGRFCRRWSWGQPQGPNFPSP